MIEDEHKRAVELVLSSMTGYAMSAALDMKLPDQVGSDGRDCAELALLTGTDAPTLRRLLRALAALGVLDEPEADRFRLTPVGELLRADHPDSLLKFGRALGDPLLVAAWTELPEALRTGSRRFDDLFGEPFWAWLGRHPEKSTRFNAGMDLYTEDTARAILDVFDFTRFETLLDIGGGNGTMLAALVAATPGMTGILFDTESGHGESEGVLRSAGVADRTRVVTGNFFDQIPGGADVHMVKSVLHNWSDDDAVRILAGARRVLPPGGRLLIVETILSETVDASARPSTYLLDLAMLLNVGGEERTCSRFERVCARGGFTIAAVHPLAVAPSAPFAFSLIECTLA